MNERADGGSDGGAVAATVVVPARLEADRIGVALRNLLASDLDGRLAVVVVCNGPADDTPAIVEEQRGAFEQRGWRLSVDRIEQPGKCAAIRHGASVADAGPIIVLDVRIGLRPTTIDRLLRGRADRNWDIASARLDYVEAGDALCRSFARAYAATPFARSSDLKGTCVVVSPTRRDVLVELPDVAAEDRYYLSMVDAGRRGAVDEAVVDYHFPHSARALVGQQVRWAAANRATEPMMGEHDRSGHEIARRPYFGDRPPRLRDRIVYSVVAASARLGARLRPMRGSAW